MRKTVLGILVLAIFMMMPARVYGNLPARPPNYGAVLDLANVLSADTINRLTDANDELFFYTGGEVMILFVDFVPMGRDISDFAMDVFNAWGIGDEVRNNGILVAAAIGEGQFWATAGLGLHEHMPGAFLTNTMEAYFAPYFNDGNFDQAALEIFGVFSERIYQIFLPLANQPYIANQPRQGGNFMGTFSTWIGLAIVIFIFVILISSSMGVRRRRMGMGMGGGMMPRRRWGWGGGWGMGRRRMGMGGLMGGFMLGRASARRQNQRNNRGGGFGGGGGMGGAGGGGAGGGFSRGGGTRGGGGGRR